MTLRLAWAPIGFLGLAVALAGCSGGSSNTTAASTPSPSSAVTPSTSPSPSSTGKAVPIVQGRLLPPHLSDSALGVKRASVVAGFQQNDPTVTEIDLSNQVGKTGTVLVAVVCFGGRAMVKVGGTQVSAPCTGQSEIAYHAPAHGQDIAVSAHTQRTQHQAWALGLYSGS